MKNSIFFFLMMSCCCTLAFSQTTYTEHLKTRVAGQGTVIIVQDAEIAAIVNNTERAKDLKKKWKEKESQISSTTPDATSHTENAIKGKQRYKTQGYRIQVFTGGNSRSDKLEAERIEKKCRAEFPELSVYKHFVSPRWICRVGDFKTYEDAAKYQTLLKNAQISYEVRIVKSVVWLR